MLAYLAYIAKRGGFMNNKQSIIKSLDIYINENINNKDDLFLLKEKIQELKYDNTFNLIKELLTINNKFYNLVKDLYLKTKEEDLDDPFINLLIENYIEKDNIDIYEINIDANYSSSLNIYLKDLKKYQILSQEEEVELFKKYREENDLKARKKLIEHNLRLVVYVAKKFKYRNIEIMDIIDEGNIGLINALERFDYKKGIKFSTYAVYWINRSIYQMLNKNNDFKLSTSMVIEVRHYNKLKKEVENKYQRKFNVQELSTMLNIDINKINNYENINQIWKVSLNDSYQDSNKEKIELIVDTTQNVEEDYLKKDIIEKLQHALNSKIINEREKEIILRRYGFYDKEYNYEEIGLILGISRQAVQQQEQRTIKRLKNSEELKKFADLSNQREYLNSFYQYFAKENKEIINKLLKRLKEYDYQTLLEIYQNDLNNKNIVKTKEKEFFIKEIIIPQIKDLLKSNYKSNRYKIKTIYELFSNYSKEEVNNAIANLNDKDKQILFYRYGEDLENPVNVYWQAEYKDLFYKHLLNKIRRNLNGKKKYTYKMKTIFEIFNEYSKKEVEEVIKSLNENDKHTLFLRYGEDLENPIDTYWDKKYNSKFYGSLLPFMKKKLEGQNIERIPNLNRSKDLKIIFDYFPEYPKELIYYIINLLTNEEKNIILLRYGNDIDKPIKNSLWDSKYNSLFYKDILCKIKKLLNIYASNIMFINDIKILDNNYSNYLELLKYKYQDLLEKYDIREAMIIILSLGNTYNTIFSINTLSNYFKYSEDEIKNIIKNYIFTLENQDLVLSRSKSVNL